MTHDLFYYATELPKLTLKERRRARPLINKIVNANLAKYGAEDLLLAVYFTGIEHAAVLTESQIQNPVGQGDVLRGSDGLEGLEYRLVHSQGPRTVLPD